MKVLVLAALMIAAPAAGLAQRWEFGADGGAGVLNNVSATSTAGSATAGFAPGFAVGAFAGESLYAHISGEMKYEYMQSDLRLSSGGQTAQFSGAAHAIHFDFLFHTGTEKSPAQFLAAAGGGVKVFVWDRDRSGLSTPSVSTAISPKHRQPSPRSPARLA